MMETNVPPLNPDNLVVVSPKDLANIAMLIVSSIQSYYVDNIKTNIDSSTRNNGYNTVNDTSGTSMITTDEVLNKLKISSPTLWRYGLPKNKDSKYYLPHYKINGKNMYRLIDVERVYNLKFGDAL